MSRVSPPTAPAFCQPDARDLPRLIVLGLILAGAILPVLGAILAILRALTTLNDHLAVLDQFEQLKSDETVALDALGDEKSAELEAKREAISNACRAQRAALGVTPTTWGNLDSIGERAVSKALHLATAGNGGNAARIVIGIAASTFAAIWSLWPPPA